MVYNIGGHKVPIINFHCAFGLEHCLDNLFCVSMRRNKYIKFGVVLYESDVVVLYFVFFVSWLVFHGGQSVKGVLKKEYYLPRLPLEYKAASHKGPTD